MHRGRKRLSLPMQLAAGFASAFLLVCLASYLVHTELRHARVASNAAAGEIRVIAAHHSLIKSVIDAETGLRGYLITGEVVLVSVATELQQWLRASDIACRVGGEELLLVLPDASLDVAVARA